jgi:hypothetical protein
MNRQFDSATFLGLTNFMNKDEINSNLDMYDLEEIEASINIANKEKEDEKRKFKNPSNKTEDYMKDIKQILEGVDIIFECDDDDKSNKNYGEINKISEPNIIEEDKRKVLINNTPEYIEEPVFTMPSLNGGKSLFEDKTNYGDAETSIPLLVSQNGDRYNSNNQGDEEKESVLNTTSIKDIKRSKIDAINLLKQALSDEGYDCSHIPHVEINSRMDDIEDTLQRLIKVGNKKQYSSFLMQIAVLVGTIMGNVFDGSREIPILKCKPDYRGYQEVLYEILSDNKYHTSEMVGEVLDKYHLSHSSLLMLSVLPSFFTYPIENKMGGSSFYDRIKKRNKMKKQQSEEEND